MNTINPAQVPQQYQRALRHQNAGQLDDALKIYSAILNINPRVAEVHFQAGRIFHTVRQYKKAALHLNLAKDLKPKEFAIWDALAETLRLLDDQKANSDFLKTVMGVGLPREQADRLVAKLNTASHSGTSIGQARKSDIDTLVSLIRNERFQQAEMMALKLQAKHPKVALIANVLASAQVSLNKPDAAIANFKKAIALDHKYAEAYSNYGRLLTELGKKEDALGVLETALKLAPNDPTTLVNMGVALTRANQDKEAEAVLKKAIRKAPKMASAHFNLGISQAKTMQQEKAVESYKKAIRHGYRTPDAYVFLGLVQNALKHDDEAMANFDKAIEIDASYPLAQFQKAALWQAHGEFEQASQYMRKAIELAPTEGSFYRAFVTANKLSVDDPLIEKMIEQFDAPDATITNRRTFAFSLAKVMEDTGQYDQVFKYLNPANELMRQEFPYDIAVRHTEVDNVKRAFEGIDLGTLKDVGYADYAPIFVTGMPRSGTTLVEQIIASHSTVTGAGEVGFIPREAYKYLINKDKSVNRVQDFAARDFYKIGHSDAVHMKKLLPEADRMTDKSIQTFTFLGLVKLALPNSKIVVVRRDPKDNLLSIYKNMFIEGTHLYAYDLRTLGEYYKIFVDILEFWRDLMPDSFYEIQYEDLIANPEEESRKLIAACGLDWEDQCLNFHQNKRRVDTLSLHQVRQPIYKSSLRGWKRYESELADLFEALE